jgi:hypothetical protein
MRSLLIAAAALALPAAAQARPHHDAPVTDSLPSPEAVDRGAYALDRAVDGLLQVDVGPVVDALHPYRSYGRHHRTLGDIGRRDDPYFDENIHRQIGALANGMNEMSYKMKVLEPTLRRSLADMARNVQDALHDTPPDRYDRDYYDRYYRDYYDRGD